MGLVTAFCPPMAVQFTGKTRFVADSKMNPPSLVGHVKTTFVPDRVMVSCAAARPASIRPRPVISAGRRIRVLKLVFVG